MRNPDLSSSRKFAGSAKYFDGSGNQNGRSRHVSVNDKASVEFHRSSTQCDEQERPSEQRDSEIGGANEAVANAPELGRGHNAPGVLTGCDDAPQFIKDLRIVRIPIATVETGACPLRSQGDLTREASSEPNKMCRRY